MNEVNFLKVDEIIKIIDKAADKNWISRVAAENIIYEILETANNEKYKRP